MRIFAISDLHLDYEANRKWFYNLSSVDFREDVLILAGDITDNLTLLAKSFDFIAKRFATVLFVPGNHDLWIWRDDFRDCFGKLRKIQEIAKEYNIETGALRLGGVLFVPLYGWYDYSFGEPSEELKNTWTDFAACKWPQGYREEEITSYFLSLNRLPEDTEGCFVVSYSHFLPRIDLMPSFIPKSKRTLYPVLGTARLEKYVRKLGSQIHIYGHTHVNNRIRKNNTLYINNAFGYPYEGGISAKRLLKIHSIA